MKTAATLAPAALLIAASVLGGCARDATNYPSLAPRPIEKLGFAEPEVPVVAVQPDPALDTRIAAAGATLDRLTKGFDTDAQKATAAASRAKGQAVGSDAWLDAQTALAALDDWRAQTSSLLTDVDAMATDRAATLAPAYPTLTALRERTVAASERQSATIDRIQASLPAA